MANAYKKPHMAKPLAVVRAAQMPKIARRVTE